MSEGKKKARIYLPFSMVENKPFVYLKKFVSITGDSRGVFRGENTELNQRLTQDFADYLL